MQKYIKNYFDYHGYDYNDVILCEICSRLATDIHHIIYKSQGGSDNPDNLIALCRDCHNKAHDNIFTKKFLYDKRNSRKKSN